MKRTEVSKKNRERRGKQTMMHTTGTKSFARVSAEIEEDEGIQLSYVDLFIRTHVNKDGKATDAAASEIISISGSKLVGPEMMFSSPSLNSNQLFGVKISPQSCSCRGISSEASYSSTSNRVSPNPFSSREANSVKGNSNQMGKKTR